MAFSDDIHRILKSRTTLSTRERNQVLSAITAAIAEYRESLVRPDNRRHHYLAMVEWVEQTEHLATGLREHLQDGSERSTEDGFYGEHESFSSRVLPSNPLRRLIADLEHLVGNCQRFLSFVVVRPKRGPKPNVPRRWLEYRVAEALYRARVKVTEGTYGTFGRVLQLVHLEIGLDARDRDKAIREAKKAIETLPEMDRIIASLEEFSSGRRGLKSAGTADN